MERITRIMLVLLLGFTIVACAQKPKEIKISLASVVFKTVYQGPGTNIADSKIGQLNALESTMVKTALNITKWTVSNAQSKTKPEPVLILEDDLGHLFSFYQESKSVVIEVSKSKLTSIYYESDIDLDAFMNQTVSPLIHSAQLKTKIKEWILLSASPNVGQVTCYRDFPLDRAASDQLKAVLKIDSWMIMDPILNDEIPYEMALGAGKPLELDFHRGDTESTVGVIRNSDRTQIDRFQIPDSVYTEVASTLVELRASIQPSPTLPISDALYTKAQFIKISAETWIRTPIDLSLSKTDSHFAQAYLNPDAWIKLSSSLTLDEDGQKMSLTDSEGTHLTIGLISGCSAVIITKDKDAQFKEVYGLTEGYKTIGWAFSYALQQAKPSEAVYSVAPTSLSILSSYSALGDPIFIEKSLSLQESADLMSVLDRQSWRADLDETSYTFGWDPTYVFKDNKGNFIRVYNDFVNRTTVIHVKGPHIESSMGIFYLMPYQTFSDLKDAVEARFPN